MNYLMNSSLRVFFHRSLISEGFLFCKIVKEELNSFANCNQEVGFSVFFEGVYLLENQ